MSINLSYYGTRDSVASALRSGPGDVLSLSTTLANWVEANYWSGEPCTVAVNVSAN